MNAEVTREEIRFYYEYETHGELSNYYPSTIALKDKLWKTVEHYYQAQKFAGLPHEELIRCSDTPDDAKRMGNDTNLPIRSDWEEVKADVMRTALRAKFTQNEHLREKLIATGDAVLIENSQKDYYWGIGKDDTGINMLGNLLMELREEL